jgi:RNA polymerase sigma-70 factor (ECF subfamily)
MPDRSDQARVFEDLVAPCERQVYFICLGMMGNEQDAQDCAQETMFKAYRGFANYRKESKVSTWLYTISTRCCTDALRRRHEAVSLEQLQDEGFDPPGDTPSPYLALEASERKRLLREALQQLPFDHRQTIVLCDLQGLTYEETALALVLPLGTVKSRLNRARAALKIILLKNSELFSLKTRPNDERREDK